MTVLVACEESQTVCKAFREIGHTAFSCDLQSCSGGHPEWHITNDVLPLINGYCDFVTDNGQYYCLDDTWDLLIAHLPCTYLTVAGASNLYCSGRINSDRVKAGHKAAEFFMQFYNSNAKHICIENPRPISWFGLPPCNQVISPHYFGSSYSKRTYLWLKHLPPLMSTMEVLNPIKCMDAKWFNTGSTNRQKNRSKTFPEVAAAMANQWG